MADQEVAYSIGVGKNMDATQLFSMLGFVNFQELQTFLKGPLFRPFYEAYLRDFLNPEKARLKKSGKSRVRGMGIRTHQLRIVQAERWGMKRFSNKFPDKSDWDAVDHKAAFMYDVYTQNTQIYGGLFFSKQIDDAERDRRTWNLIKYVLEEEADSRVARKEVTQTNVVSTPTLGNFDDFDNQTPQSSPSLPEDPLLRARRLSPRLPSVEPQTGEEPNVETVERHGQTLTFDDPRANDVANGELLLEDDEDEGLPLSAAERLAEESISSTFNVKERFWVIWLIDQAINYTGDIDALKIKVNWASDLDAAAHRDALDWMRTTQKAMTENTLTFEKFDAVASENFDDMESFFNNLDYQRNDLQIASESIGIVWQGSDTIFRVPGMSVAEELSYWQPTAIHWLREMRESSLVKGCIYADYMGLGKTWSVIVFLLTLRNDYLALPREERTGFKPVLLILPIFLINQWVKAFDRVCPGIFSLWVYHETTRSQPLQNPVGTERKVPGKLSADHEFFDPETMDNVFRIILTTPQTWAKRHGPEAQKKWRESQDTTGGKHELDPDFEWSPAGLFDIVIIDEAHSIKSLGSNINTAILWIACLFFIGITGTPTPNGAPDFKGWIRLLEHLKSYAWWTLDNQDINPFELPDDHEDARLRFTETAVNEFVMSRNFDPVGQGRYLKKLFKHILLRRQHSSKLPFDSDVTIGQNLPRIHSVMVNCRYKPDELKRYKDIEDEKLGLLETPGKGKRKGKGVFTIQRELNMAIMWPELLIIDAKDDPEYPNLKSVSIRKWLQRPNPVLDDWFEILMPGKQLTVQEKLHYLLRGDPKLRAFLRNVRSQVLRDKEKCIAWFQTPGCLLKVAQVLEGLLGIDTLVILAGQKQEERERIVSVFNDDPEKGMILLSTYGSGYSGLDLQKRCHYMHFLESPYNKAMKDQAMHRCRRMGCPYEVVHVFEYYIEGTVASRSVQSNIEKYIPEAAALMNSEIIDEGAEVDVHHWVEFNGQLIDAHDMEVAGLGLPTLSPADVIRHVIKSMSGETIEIA